MCFCFCFVVCFFSGFYGIMDVRGPWVQRQVPLAPFQIVAWISFLSCLIANLRHFLQNPARPRARIAGLSTSSMLFHVVINEFTSVCSHHLVIFGLLIVGFVFFF